MAMDFEKYNEEIKEIMTSFQMTEQLDLERLQKTHENIKLMLFPKIEFKEYILLLDNAFLEMQKGNLEYLIKDKNSYHNVLWQLHTEFIKKNINPNIFYYKLGNVLNHFSKTEFKENLVKVLISEHNLERLKLCICFLKENGYIEDKFLELTIFTFKQRKNYFAYLSKQNISNIELEKIFLNHFFNSLKDLDFITNKKEMKDVFDKWKTNPKGKIISYIPFLKRMKYIIIYYLRLFFVY